MRIDTIPAMSVAKFLILLSSNSEYDMTNLKLQKLLYYCQGMALAELDRKLFDEEIEAWEHGPVVKEVYFEYSQYGRNLLPIPLESEKMPIYLSLVYKENVQIIKKTFEKYAIYTAWKLRNMTKQKDSPWDKTYPLYRTIDVELIRRDCT